MGANEDRRLTSDVLTALESLLALPFGELIEDAAVHERLIQLFRARLPALAELETVEPASAARRVGAVFQEALEELLASRTSASSVEPDVDGGESLPQECPESDTPPVEEFGGASDELEMSTRLFALEKNLEDLFSNARRKKGSLSEEELAEDALPSLGRVDDDEPTSELLAGEYPDLSGEVLCDKYRVHRVVGIGGYGAVYEASDLILGYRVAIKVLSPRAAAEDLEAFREEARRVTRLSCPNIVEWKSFEQETGGTCFFVMEYLDGEDLEVVIRREGQLAPTRVTLILLQILNALRSAHELPGGGSVLHLDLKPKNVFLLPARVDEAERVKVIDFGIGQYFGGEEVDASRRDEEPEAEGPIRAAKGPAHGLGFPLSRACTPEYASPEQCAHLTLFSWDDPRLVQLDGRSDLYSLGVLAYRMLAGRLPYDKPERRTDWLKVHQKQAHRPLAEEELEVSRELITFVERCLAKDREQRWPTAQAAYENLWGLADHSLRHRLF